MTVLLFEGTVRQDTALEEVVGEMPASLPSYLGLAALGIECSLRSKKTKIEFRSVSE